MNYKYRMHDPRIGRFFAVDPLSPEYPWYSPYQFGGNTPIWKVELEGLEPGPAKYQEAQDQMESVVDDMIDTIQEIYEDAEKTTEEMSKEAIETLNEFLGEIRDQINDFYQAIDSPVEFSELRVVEGNASIQYSVGTGLGTGYAAFEIAAGEGSIAGHAFSGFDIAARLNIGIESNGMDLEEAKEVVGDLFEGDWEDLIEDFEDWDPFQLTDIGWTLNLNMVMADHMTANQYGAEGAMAFSIHIPVLKQTRAFEVVIAVNENYEISVGISTNLKVKSFIQKGTDDNDKRKTEVKFSYQYSNSGTANHVKGY